MNDSRPTGAARYEYVLGDSSLDAERLDRQAQLWDPIAHRLFKRIGVNAGWRALEIGPGRASVHMQLRRMTERPVDAVERSPIFAAAVRDRTRADGRGEGRIWQTDLMSAALERNACDLVYARWVFCFLPDPALHIRKLAGALEPGGLLAIQDYVAP